METQEQINAYQALFDHMEDEYGVILTQSHMDEIIRLSKEVVESYNKPPTKINKAMDINITENEVSTLRKQNSLCIKLEEIPRFGGLLK